MLLKNDYLDKYADSEIVAAAVSVVASVVVVNGVFVADTADIAVVVTLVDDGVAADDDDIVAVDADVVVAVVESV